MAWGFWNKIKSGLKKAWNFGKNLIGGIVGTAAKVVPAIAPVLDRFKPGLGLAVETGVNGANEVMKAVDNGDWTNAFDNAKALSTKIRLK